MSDENSSGSDSDETQGLPPEESKTRRTEPEKHFASLTAALPVIDGFRIVRELGAGGMGVVYEAEQQDPVRAVALKVIRGGHRVDEAAVRMFQREGQALARLRHRGIAAIFASGSTIGGQHYFAMELVRGTILSEFLEGRESPVDSSRELEFRLAIFLKVCDAINYAHQRGVIHRDLKPSNIMVVRGESSLEGSSVSDPIPEIKILDFGLARITDADIEVATVVTELGKVQGTLAYMSPEQSRGNADEIDLRSDLYSLGVILYELICGKRPYTLGRSSMFEALRVICEEEPVSFSRALGRRRSLNRDLELVVMTALEKDPACRYQSVTEFGADLVRYRSRQPILARPHSTLYQLRKAVSRHKIGFAFGSSFLVMLLVLTVGLGVSYRRVRQERDRANSVRQFLTGLFELSDPTRADRDRITARAFFEQGARRIETSHELDPRVRASLMDTIGRVLLQLGMHERALPLLESACSIRSEQLGATALPTAETLVNLGWAHAEAKNYAAAESEFRRALEIRRNALGEGALALAGPLIHLGNLHWEQGHYGEAEPYYRRAIQVALASQSPASLELATAQNNLGILLKGQRKYREAEELLRNALAVRERILGPESLAVSTTLNNLGEVLRAQGRLDEAAPLYRRVLRIREKLLDPGDPRIGVALNNLGEVFRERDDLVRAEDYYSRSLTLFENVLPANDARIGVVAFNLGDVHMKRGESAKAVVRFEQSLAIGKSARVRSPYEIAETLTCLGEALAACERWEEAETRLRRALEILGREAVPDDGAWCRPLEGLAGLCERSGREGEAARLRERAEAIREIGL